MDGILHRHQEWILKHTDPLRPFVTLTWAQTIDGSIAAIDSQPLKISNQESMRFTHQLRAGHQGIAVGIGTVLHDNPSLTTRLVPGPSPIPIIFDSKLKTPSMAKCLERDRKAFLICSESIEFVPEGLSEKNILKCPEKERKLDLRQALCRVKEQGIDSVMIEGGASIIESFLRGYTDVIDQVIVTISPSFVGGLTIVRKPLESQLELIDVESVCLSGDTILQGRFPRLSDK